MCERKAKGTTFPTREYLGAMCLFLFFGGRAEPKQCRAVGLGGRDGGIPSSFRKLFDTRRWIWALDYFFFFLLPLFLFFSSPPPPLFLLNQIRNVSQCE